MLLRNGTLSGCGDAGHGGGEACYVQHALGTVSLGIEIANQSPASLCDPETESILELSYFFQLSLFFLEFLAESIDEPESNLGLERSKPRGESLSQESSRTRASCLAESCEEDESIRDRPCGSKSSHFSLATREPSRGDSTGEHESTLERGDSEDLSPCRGVSSDEPESIRSLANECGAWLFGLPGCRSNRTSTSGSSRELDDRSGPIVCDAWRIMSTPS